MLLLIAAVLALASTADARTWHWPVRGEVVQAYSFDRHAPFARGRHRGIEIEGRQGAPVRAACAGRVIFAGELPRHGGTVSVGCGQFVTTYLHLSSMAVRTGVSVGSGAPLGAAGARPVGFGVRRAGDRRGYLDPLSLLPADPLGPAPAPPAPAATVRRPHPDAPSSMPEPVPAIALAGASMLALTIPGLAVVRGRARRQPSAATKALASRT